MSSSDYRAWDEREGEDGNGATTAVATSDSSNHRSLEDLSSTHVTRSSHTQHTSY